MSSKAADRRPRILVVDDEPGIREVIARVLRAEGFEVVMVNDGRAGLVAVREAEAPYDLVITLPHDQPRFSARPDALQAVSAE